MKQLNENTLILNGTLNLEEGTITESADEAEVVWNFNELARSFNNKEVSIIIKEKTRVKSVR